MPALAIAVLSVSWAASPDVWTARTPVGELAPGTTRTRLVDADVEIRILDADVYEVRSTYQLHNPGEPEVVRWSVPISSGGKGGSEGASAEAASVRVLANGVFVPCLVGSGEAFTLPVPSAVGADRGDRWCSADVTLPEGLSELRLSFEGALLYEASSTPESLVKGGVERTLAHALFPAAHWVKKPDAVRVVVDPGPYAGKASAVQPPGAASQGRLIAWTLDAPDLARTPWVVVQLSAPALDLHARVARHNVRGPAWSRPTQVKVSSAQDAAARMLDADGHTAWCANTGVGAWAELSWVRPSTGTVTGTCSLALLAIPGDASSAAAWDKSGRPTRVRASACGKASANTAVELVLPGGTGPLASAAAVRVGEPLAAAWSSAMASTDPKAAAPCVRVEVLELQGSAACLTELAWQASCP